MFWAVPPGSLAAAAVAHPDVEVAVRPEGDAAAVVVRVRLAIDEELAAGRALVDVVRVRGDPVFVDDRGAVDARRVVDVQLAVRLEARVEREAEEAAFAAATVRVWTSRKTASRPAPT